MRRNNDLRAEAVAKAMVVAIGSLIQVMRACLWSDAVDDPQARQLLSNMADA
jgi:hypothetical protein